MNPHPPKPKELTMIRDTEPTIYGVYRGRERSFEEIAPNSHLRYDEDTARRWADLYRQMGDPYAAAGKQEVAA